MTTYAATTPPAGVVRRLLRTPPLPIPRIRNPVTALYVTGSYARGTATPASDLDIAVVLDVPKRCNMDAITFTERRWSGYITRPRQQPRYRGCPVDIQFFWADDPELTQISLIPLSATAMPMPGTQEMDWNTRITTAYVTAQGGRWCTSDIVAGSIAEGYLRQMLTDDGDFIPGDVGLSEHIPPDDSEDADPYVWHRLERVTYTHEPPTVPDPAAMILDRMLACAIQGWPTTDAARRYEWQQRGMNGRR